MCGEVSSGNDPSTNGNIATFNSSHSPARMRFVLPFVKGLQKWIEGLGWERTEEASMIYFALFQEAFHVLKAVPGAYKVRSRLPDDLKKRIPALACLGMAAAQRQPWINDLSQNSQRSEFVGGSLEREQAAAESDERRRHTRAARIAERPVTSAEKYAYHTQFAKGAGLSFLGLIPFVGASLAASVKEADRIVVERWMADERRELYGTFFVGRLAGLLEEVKRQEQFEKLVEDLCPTVKDPSARSGIEWLLDRLEQFAQSLVGIVDAARFRRWIDPLRFLKPPVVVVWLQRQFRSLSLGFRLWQFQEIYSAENPRIFEGEAQHEYQMHKERIRQGGRALQRRVEEWFGKGNFDAALQFAREEGVMGHAQRAARVIGL